MEIRTDDGVVVDLKAQYSVLLVEHPIHFEILDRQALSAFLNPQFAPE